MPLKTEYCDDIYPKIVARSYSSVKDCTYSVVVPYEVTIWGRTVC